MNESITYCLLCKSDSLKPLTAYKRDYLVRCRKCSFVFARRIPSSSELDECYSKYPRANQISPITIKRYKENLDFFANYHLTGNILDVGAGEGWFLKEAQNQGWNAFGTEYEMRAVQQCREKGINMQPGILNPDNYSPGFFDVITSFEVVEHIQNPAEEFSNFYYLLRPGGIVYVTTPNFSSLSRTFLGASWNIINYPEHLSYYSPSTLTKAFRNAGFDLVQLETSGISPNRLMQSFLRPHAKKEKDRKPAAIGTELDESLRNFTESGTLGPAIKRLANATLKLFGAGDTIKAIFKKQDA